MRARDLLRGRGRDPHDGLRAGEQLAARDDLGAGTYSASSNPARPGVRSTATVKPAAVSRPTESGTSATRRSPAPASFGTATLTESELYGAARPRGRNRRRPWKAEHRGVLLATFSAALEPATRT